jgi:regulator of replication initiation timing
MDLTTEGFEQIAAALLEMQQKMQALIQENRQLREELAALRRGVGITLVIEGQPFLLNTTFSTPAELTRVPF